MLARIRNKNESLFLECDSFLQWGNQHTYHWFWGIIKLKTVNKKKDATEKKSISIQENVHEYESGNTIKNLRMEVEKYRRTTAISRFFIWLFNYDNLFKKHILLTYYELKTHAQYIKSETIRFENASFDWEPAILKFAINACKNMSDHLSAFGYMVKKSWFRITEYLVKEYESYHLENDQPSTLNSRKVYHLEQVKALSVLGITARIGSTFFEVTVKQNFRALAKEFHSDKGGADEKFRELTAARDLLLNKFRINPTRTKWYSYPLLFPEDLFEMYENRCVSLRENSLIYFNEKLANYIAILDNYKTHGHEYVEESLKSLAFECKCIITEYEIERRKTFAEYLQVRNERFGEDGLVFECYEEEANRKLAIKNLEEIFEASLAVEKKIIHSEKHNAELDKYLCEHAEVVEAYLLRKQEEGGMAGDTENAGLYRLINDAPDKLAAIDTYTPLIKSNNAAKADENANLSVITTNSFSSPFTTSMPLFGARKKSMGDSIIAQENTRSAMFVNYCGRKVE